MKRILLGALGNIAALFAAGMDQAWTRPSYARQYGARPQVRAAFKLTGRPTDKRHWHTGEGAQIDQIDDAQEKRERRAEKMKAKTHRSQLFNAAHFGLLKVADDGYILPLNLNPFYVAK